MAITDLTGTTWKFNVPYTSSLWMKNLTPYNSSLYRTDSAYFYSVNFSFVRYSTTFNLTNFALGYDSSQRLQLLFFSVNTGAAFALNSPTTEEYEVTFNGGTDITNADFIAWVQANAVKQEETKPKLLKCNNKTVYKINEKYPLKVNETLVSGGIQSTVYPVKGDLITMTLGNSTPAAGTNNQYRVLSINGSIAEVVAMYDISTSCYYNSSGTNTYSGAELDTMLNTTFYSSLSSTAKAAIVDKTITSYEYTYNSSVYNATTHASYADYSTKATHESIGSRHVYALDVEDIENYFSNTFSTANIWTLFWNTTARPSTVTYPWLRSADAVSSRNAWRVSGGSGYVTYDIVYFADAVRPALTIDLSKIEWTKIE